MKDLTQITLKELLHYDPETGVFTWLRRDQKYFDTLRGFKIWNGRYAGQVAGWVWKRKSYSCRYLRFFGTSYPEHRLAWFYVNGVWPTEILHDNQDGTDNRIVNLFDGTRSENMKNLRRPGKNTSGTMGVYLQKQTGRWRVRFKYNGVYVEGGRTFRTLANAKRRLKDLHAAYGLHPNHGRPAPTTLEA